MVLKSLFHSCMLHGILYVDPQPLNPVNEDNGIRNQLLMTLFLEYLEPEQSSTEMIPDVKDIITVWN